MLSFCCLINLVLKLFYCYYSENHIILHFFLWLPWLPCLKVQTVYIRRFSHCPGHSASTCYNYFQLSIEFYRRKKKVKLSEFAEQWPYVQSQVTEVLGVEQVVS